MKLQEITPEQLEELSRLDAAGYLVGRDEDPDTYFERLNRLRAEEEALNRELAANGSAEPFPGLTVREQERIPPEIVAEAAELTEALYAFRIDHVPGFFLSGNVGLLWGGCLVSDTDSPLAVFLIRSSFRTRERFFIYQRRELLAHELCHSARSRLFDYRLEEFFAYQTSPSRLRRYLGNCFIRQCDALLFMLPTLLLLTMQLLQSFVWPRLPVWPFWILALAYPAFLLWRNQLARRRVFRAAAKLQGFGFRRVRPILFRLTWEELALVAEQSSPAALREWAEARARHNLRWKVLVHRFFREEEEL